MAMDVDTQPGSERSGNSVFTFRDAAVLAVHAVDAPELVPSSWFDEQLAEVYGRTGLRGGVMFKLAGIDARRWWPEGMAFDEPAAQSGRAALDAAGVTPHNVDMLIASSVSRHHLEPSIAASVHHRLGLPAGCLNFDVSNACLGFLNAMQIAGAAIDTGAIDTALIVDAEGSRRTQLATIDRLCSSATTTDDVFAEFATLTLGSGAAAMVMGRASEHPGAHRVVGGVGRSGSRHHELCVGDLDGMHTDSGGLLSAGIELVEATWHGAQDCFDWHDGVDHYVIHQISKVHTRLVIDRLDLPRARVPVTFPQLGNVGPAAIPITLAGIADRIEPGERVLCMGVGSGLNTCYLEIEW